MRSNRLLLLSTTVIPLAMVAAGGLPAGAPLLATPAFAACSPCNPCAAQKAPCNPCNPCAAANPCNPCNPCKAN